MYLIPSGMDSVRCPIVRSSTHFSPTPSMSGAQRFGAAISRRRSCFGCVLCQTTAPADRIAMKPHVICHMATSLDGRILPDRWAPSDAHSHAIYEHLHVRLGGGAWIVGRVT